MSLIYAPSHLLPESARARLMKAAATPIGDDPLARRKAIEIVTNLIKTQYPQYFQLTKVTL